MSSLYPHPSPYIDYVVDRRDPRPPGRAEIILRSRRYRRGWMVIG